MWTKGSRRILFLSGVLTLALLLPSFAMTAALPDFVLLAQQLKPAVVNISTSKKAKVRRPVLPPGPRTPGNDFFDEFFDRFFQGQPGPTRPERSLGSGFIISADGFILTNGHVVDGADEIKVRLSDGRTFVASVKGLDPKLDLALVKIDTGEDLPFAVLGDSATLRVGEWVMAIGNPFGLEQTVTAGIVSAKGRVIGAGPYDDFIQTDASINPGNSGGPLFNIDGKVVGINTAIVAGGQGIGFAIPVNAARNIIEQLKETGHVVRGWLGVSVQAVTEELAASFGLKDATGALVSEVIKDSPAEKGGVKRGDIILSFNGTPVDALNDLPRQVADTPVGTRAKVEVFRNGKTRELTVTVGRLVEEATEGRVPEAGEGALGLAVTDLTPEVANQYGIEGGKGVLITGIDPSGTAAAAGLRPGDLIVEMNGREIATVKDYRAALAQVKSGQILRLLIQRGESLLYTTVRAQ
jgi:serine protease Do